MTDNTETDDKEQGTGSATDPQVEALPAPLARKFLDEKINGVVEPGELLGPGAATPAEERAIASARASLSGQRRGIAALLPFLGPAFIAAVAYVDPGNFATNIEGGARFGYMLLWVILWSNLMAMLLQALSAKLGIATGRSLPEMCRDRFPKPVVYGLWISAEVVAMATDLAEFLGAAVGFYLLFRIPLLAAGVLTGITTFLILLLQRRGFRPVEATIASLIGVISVSYIVETILARPDFGQIAYHVLVPQITSDAVLVSVGILGATVMPHVVYLHSSLTQSRIVPRSTEEARRIFRFEVFDVVIAMGLAGVINMAMMFTAAAVFWQTGNGEVGSILEAHQTLQAVLGSAAAPVFAIALLASGLSSSAVGTMAGQVIMQGFVHFGIPLWLRRLLTMLPALVVIAIGLDPQQVLVISQVVLSFGLPFAVVPLVYFTAKKDIMGGLVNKRLTTVAAVACATAIIALNMLLLYQVVGGSIGE